MQWTKIIRQTVHDAMTGNDNDARNRKGRTDILTIGEMHARMLVWEDGFGTIASRGTAAQSAGVTSPCSSPQGPSAGARLFRWRRINRFTCDVSESLEYLWVH